MISELKPTSNQNNKEFWPINPSLGLKYFTIPEMLE